MPYKIKLSKKTKCSFYFLCFSFIEILDFVLFIDFLRFFFDGDFKNFDLEDTKFVFVFTEPLDQAIEPPDELISHQIRPLSHNTQLLSHQIQLLTF